MAYHFVRIMSVLFFAAGLVGCHQQQGLLPVGQWRGVGQYAPVYNPQAEQKPEADDFPSDMYSYPTRTIVQRKDIAGHQLWWINIFSEHPEDRFTGNVALQVTLLPLADAKGPAIPCLVLSPELDGKAKAPYAAGPWDKIDAETIQKALNDNTVPQAVIWKTNHATVMQIHYMDKDEMNQSKYSDLFTFTGNRLTKTGFMFGDSGKGWYSWTETLHKKH